MLCDQRLPWESFLFFFPPSVQPLAAWYVCWQRRYCGFCSQSTGESGHPSAQHATVGGRDRGRGKDFEMMSHNLMMKSNSLLGHHSLNVLFSLQINGVEKQTCRELHIAYRYGDHYDSVRRTGDNSENPAQLRIEVCNIQWTYIPNLVNSRSTSLDSQECIMSCLQLLMHPLPMCLWWFLALAVSRICRIHKASSGSLGTVRGTDEKTLLPQPQRRTTWSWVPSRIEESRVRSYTWFISCRKN